jgi:hypothetical protein
MLTEEHITKFQTIYQNRFGKTISREEAYEQGMKLIELVKLIYKPMTEEEYQKYRRKPLKDKNL